MDPLLQAALGTTLVNSQHVAAGQRVRFRVFIEGVEVPAISVQVHAMPNSPLMASIQVPPMAEGTRLAPRSVVHIYFQDGFALSNPHMFATQVPPGAVGVSTTGDVVTPSNYAQADPSNPPVIYPGAVGPCGDCLPIWTNGLAYKLVFMGELHGFAWTKQPMSRSLVLQCAGLTNYWDVAQQAENTDLFGPGMKTMFSGTGTTLFTDFLESKGSMLTAILVSGRCNTYPKMKGIAAGVVRLIESIGGCYTTAGMADDKNHQPKIFSGQNLFFSIAELKYHFMQMLAMIEEDPTSSRILHRQGWDGMFDRMLSGMGSTVSMRAAISALSKIIFYDCYEQPCPIYIPGSNDSVSGQKRVPLAEGGPGWEKFEEYRASALKAIEGVHGEINDPGNNDLSDPAKAEKGDPKKPSEGYNNRNNSVSHRNYLRRDWGDRLRALQVFLGQALAELNSLQMPAYIVSRVVQVKTLVTEATWHVNNWEPNAKGNFAAITQANQRLDKAVAILRGMADAYVNITDRSETSPARLGAVVYKPDIWFAAPPRCNVLFPDQYTQLSYQRSFLAEPTRFLLKLNDEFFGEDELFDHYYFAPKGPAVKRKGKAQLQQLFGSELMDHELFTGILPVFEKMGEFNVFSARDGDATVRKVGFAQRSVNFLYFKQRFQARQLQVEARFNPYVAPGFPGLILDKYVDLEVAGRLRELREKMPMPANRDPGMPYLPPMYALEILGTNFLASFSQVIHSASYESGQATTSITCQYARQVEEKTEFLGVHDDDTAKKQKTGAPPRQVASLVACYEAPRLYSLGPQGGVITSVTPASDMAPAGSTLRFFFGGYKRENKTPQKDVPVLVEQKLTDYGYDIAEMLGGAGSRKVTLLPYMVHEDVDSYKRESTELPMEELIRPGWYGDIWSPSQIGKAYQALIGTGSIVDPTQVGNKDLASDGELDEEDGAYRQSILELGPGTTTEQAVEFLVQTYSYVKQSGADVDQFIRSYVARNTASMVDIFGTDDLQFDSDGKHVVQGMEGFHSKAFGQYEDLFGLVTDEIESVLGVDRADEGRRRADTRKRKQDLVLAYATQLRVSRSVIG